MTRQYIRRLSPEELKKLKEKQSRERSGKSNAMYGIHRSGKDSPSWGKECLLKTKEKISKARKGQHNSPKTEFKKGECFLEKNQGWKGGTSFGTYGIRFNNELRESIRKRDKHKCQICFRNQKDIISRDGKKRLLSIHHIDYNKKNNSENNLNSLCQSCHMKTEFNRSHWTKHFQEMLKCTN